jgi:hypothetical protein
VRALAISSKGGRPVIKSPGPRLPDRAVRGRTLFSPRMDPRFVLRGEHATSICSE